MCPRAPSPPSLHIDDGESSSAIDITDHQVRHARSAAFPEKSDRIGELSFRSESDQKIQRNFGVARPLCVLLTPISVSARLSNILNSSITPRANHRMQHDTGQGYAEIEAPTGAILASEARAPGETGVWSLGRRLLLKAFLCGSRSLSGIPAARYREPTQTNSTMPLSNPIFSEEVPARDALARSEKEWQFSVVISLAVTIINFIIYCSSINGVVGALASRCIMLSAASSALGVALILFLRIYIHNGGVQQIILGRHFNLFFAIISRAPLVFMLFSLVGLSSALLLMAYSVSPKVVVAISAIVVFLVGLESITKVVLMVWSARRAFIPTTNVVERNAQIVPRRTND
ncbi:hypothetical protein PENSPDRAFT_659663 [Peniophora sp. CONT]|nr:hypothetical protein PENSPDRAFT_659663 [Peniophora sp. CONT]